MGTINDDKLNYFLGYPRQTLHQGQYEILRKLGRGVYSNTWLVKDAAGKHQSKYLAAKILTKEGTDLHHQGLSKELELLQKIKGQNNVYSLPILRDHFEVAGLRGPHICFVMDLLSTDVSSFRRSAPRKALAPYIVKIILHQFLKALEQLENLKIVHTDLKMDNMLFNSIPSDEQLEDILAREPAIVEEEVKADGKTFPVFLAQPIHHSFSWDVKPLVAKTMQFTLIDFGQGQWAGIQPTVDEFSAYSLRAPELILKSVFGTGVDIWAIGCITFEMLTGQWLFAPKGSDEDNSAWSREDDHLARMMEATGEKFTDAILSKARYRSKYFDNKDNLLHIDELKPMHIEQAINNYKIVPPHEIEQAAQFIRACLRFDPGERASAKQLLSHPWLSGPPCAH